MAHSSRWAVSIGVTAFLLLLAGAIFATINRAPAVPKMTRQPLGSWLLVCPASRTAADSAWRGNPVGNLSVYGYCEGGEKRMYLPLTLRDYRKEGRQ
jgi:hypothetical protein